MLKYSLKGSNLKRALADAGFESHEDYSFAISKLFLNTDKINCLSLLGDSGRRKTALAHAFGQCLDFEYTLYHDFSQQKEPQPKIILPEPEDKSTPKDPPISALDRIVSDACAFSEAENTLLIFDQLQVADFRHQVRIHKLVSEQLWTYSKNEFTANPENLSIIFINEGELYHPLQKNSFKAWVSNASYNKDLPTTKILGFSEKLQPVLDKLAKVFNYLHTTPTQSELIKILEDIQGNVHTESDLSNSIYGWTEGIERTLLNSEKCRLLLSDVLPTIDHFLGIDQLEISK